MEQLQGALGDLAHELDVFGGNVDSLCAADSKLRSWHGSFGQLAGAVELLQRSHAVAVKNLKQQKLEAPVDDADDGMEVQAQAAPKLPRPSTSKKRSAETTTSSSTGSSTGSAGNAGISSRASKKVKTAQKKRTKVDRWAQASRDVVKDFPKRYKEKEHLDRLEVVWRTVDSKPDGAVLSDVVKVCSCSVLQANECLANLVKFKLISRKKERAPPSRRIGAASAGLRYRSLMP